METMKSEIAEDKSSSVDIQHFISLIRKCKNPTEISDSMFNELVDKIVVYEAEGAGNARIGKPGARPAHKVGGGLRFTAECAGTDDRVIGVGVHIGHRGKIQVKAVFF